MEFKEDVLPAKATFYVGEEVQDNVLKPRGVACSVFSEGEIFLLTSSSAVGEADNQKKLIAERFSSSLFGDYRLDVLFFKQLGNFTFLKIDKQYSIGRSWLICLYLESPTYERKELAKPFCGRSQLKLQFKDVGRSTTIEVISEKRVETTSIIGAPIIIRNKPMNRKHSRRFSVIGVVGLTSEEKLCPCYWDPSDENTRSLVVGGKKKEFCQPSPEDKKPPQLSFELAKTGDVRKSIKTWRDDHLPIDILLLTAESCGFLSCFSFLDQPFKCYKREIGYVYFGYMGDVRDQKNLKVALVNCSKGAAATGVSLSFVQNAVRVLGPKAVFSVGTCISLGLEKARMGDVVISSRLVTTEGLKTPASPRLGIIAQDASYGWEAPLKHPDEWQSKVHCNGDILSQSLRKKCHFDNIHEQYPQAAAIETEDEDVYAAAYDADIEWVMVKGVASYFHQSQSATSEWVSFSSTMAASVVVKMLNDPLVFQEWPHYNQERVLMSSEGSPSEMKGMNSLTGLVCFDVTKDNIGMVDSLDPCFN